MLRIEPLYHGLFGATRLPNCNPIAQPILLSAMMQDTVHTLLTILIHLLDSPSRTSKFLSTLYRSR